MSNYETGGWDSGLSLMRMWSDLATQMMEASMRTMPCGFSPDATRDLRSSMLKTWADYWDQFLRSPAFLEGMKQSLSASMQWRKQINDALGEMQQAVQGFSHKDIDQLTRTLRRLEERIAEGFDDLSARVDSVRRRVEKADRGAKAHRDTPRTKRRATENLSDTNGYEHEHKPKRKVKDQ